MRNIEVIDSVKGGKVLLDKVLVASYDKVKDPEGFTRCNCTYLKDSDATQDEIAEVLTYLHDIEDFANDHLETK